MPADAVAVASVHIADLWKHPAGKAILEKLTEGSPEIVKAIRGQFGVGPEDVDRVTLFVPALEKFPSRRDREPLVAVTTLKPYDQRAVLTAVAPDTLVRMVKGRTIYVNPSGPSLVFLDDHTYLLDEPDPLEAYLNRAEEKGERPLGPVLKQADKHLIVAGVDVASVLRMRPLPNDPNNLRETKPFLPLLKGRLATLTVDLDDKLRATAQGTFPTEADAKEGAAAVDDALDMIRGFVQAMKERTMMELNLSEDFPKVSALLKGVQAALRAAKAEQTGTTVEVAAALAVESQATTAAATEIIEKVRKEAELRPAYQIGGGRSGRSEGTGPGHAHLSRRQR